MKPSSEKVHAELSASGSERWLNCPASVAHCRNAPPEVENEYAKEGTLAHTVLETILKNHDGKPFIAARMLRDQYPDEMVDHALWAYSHIVSKIRSKEALLLSETKVSLEHLGPEMFGTLDAALVELFGTLHIWDYKYGAGIPVEAKDSTQMLYYALAIAKAYDYNFKNVSMEILQPRAEHELGPAREWVISIEELVEWEEKFKEGIARTQDPLAPFKAGDWCRWCPGKVNCPELFDKSLTEAQVDFAPATSENVLLPIPEMIPPQQLSNALKGIEKLKKWIDAVEEHAFFQMERGNKIPGYKLVEKRSIRKWTDEDEAEKKAKKIFGTKVFKTELLSPAQLEKAVKGERKLQTKADAFITDYASNKSSGLTIAPDSDKRPAIQSVDEDFTEAVSEVREAIREGLKVALPQKMIDQMLPTDKPVSKKKISKTKQRSVHG